MSSSPSLLADRYQLLEELGRGGHAAVHRARDQRLGRDVAVKLLRDEAMSANVLARFAREIRLTATLEHPHILHVHDTGVHEGRPFLVMELASGGTLADRLARESPLPILDALQVTRDVGLALAHAHAHGVVHRDVKPANILLRDGTALLADFGVAFAEPAELERRLTSAGLAVGTAQYMSPEQLCADPGVDGRSDQYSLALVLYEMLAGVPAQTARTLEGLRLQRLSAPPLGVRTHRPSVPEAIEQALQTALAPVPADRFRDVPAFLAALGISASGEFRVPGTGGYGAVGASSGGMGGRAGDVGGSGARVSAAMSAPATGPIRGARTVGMVALGVVALVGTVWGVSRWGDVGAAEDRPVAETTLATGEEDDLTRVAVTLAPPAPDALSQRLHRALEAEFGAWPDVELGAGAPAWRVTSEATSLGDSVRVRLTVARGRGTPVQLAAVGGAATDEQVRALSARLVREVLAGAGEDDAPGLAALPVRSLRAARAYAAGHRALRAGALEGAERHFASASAEAPDFHDAEYWAAQVASWARPRDRSSWRVFADRASAPGAEVASAPVELVTGLQHLAHARVFEACAQYRMAARSSPASYVAWFGLGECARLDTVVTRVGARLRYRASIWTALQAYRQVIETAVSSSWLAAVYPSIRAATFAQGQLTRRGVLEGTDTMEYRALVSLNGDSLAFEPILRREFERGGASGVPRSYAAAVQRARAVALELSQRWVARDAASAAAWLEHAAALEVAGRLGRGGPAIASVDSALRRASNVALTPVQRAHLAVLRARVALRRADLDSAAAIAQAALRDSILRASAEAAPLLAPLAALIGDTIAVFAERASTQMRDVPQAVVNSAHRFSILASTGRCAALADAAKALRLAVRTSASPADSSAIVRGVLTPVFRQAVPCTGLQLIATLRIETRLDEAYHALLDGQPARAQDALRRLRSERAGASSGSVTWDHIFAEAWAWASAGDTAEARAGLRAALDDLAGMSGYTLDFVAQAAGLRRAVLLLDSLEQGTPSDADAVVRWSRRAPGFFKTDLPEDV